MAQLKYIFGAGDVGSISAEDLEALIRILGRYNIQSIDTARIYIDSEKRLGDASVCSSFLVDTKTPCLVKQALGHGSIVAGLDKSLSLLKASKVDVYYLHMPDEDTPMEETVDTIQELYRLGKFQRFGLSNFLPEDVRKIHAYAKSTGGIAPTVYQGHYNCFARSIEQSLFPTLRELGMSFYAYSPLAGGLFAKDPDDLRSKRRVGRFYNSARGDSMYSAMYNKPSIIEGLREWRMIAEEAGEKPAILAYRWVVFHSAMTVQNGDAVIIGARKPLQLEETLEGLKAGPLDGNIVRRIEVLWKSIENDAPVDNYHSFLQARR
jgi:aflatoxin B1 aldehyde reductase